MTHPRVEISHEAAYASRSPVTHHGGIGIAFGCCCAKLLSGFKLLLVDEFVAPILPLAVWSLGISPRRSFRVPFRESRTPIASGMLRKPFTTRIRTPRKTLRCAVVICRLHDTQGVGDIKGMAGMGTTSWSSCVENFPRRQKMHRLTV